jgi:peptidoglycan/xylan/chitin deacetylase (PgdA/CDA1 family)
VRDAVAAGVLLEDATDASRWTTAGGTGTATIANGALAIASSGQAAYTVNRVVPWSLPKGGAIVVDLVSDANLSSYSVFLNCGPYSSPLNFNRVNGGTQIPLPGVPYRLVLTAASLTGSPARTLATLLQGQSLSIQVTPKAGTDTTLRILGIRAVASPTPPQVCWLFDDGRLDTYTVARPVLAANGYVGNIAVEHGNVGRVGAGTTSRVTLAHLQEMYAEGWSFLGHHDVQMGAMSQASAEAVFKASKDFLLGNGFTRGSSHWVWPGGDRSATSYGYARRFFRTARGISSPMTVALPGVFDPYEPSIRYVTNTSAISVFKDTASAAATYGGTVVFVLHSIVNSPSAPEDLSPAAFTELVEHAASLGMVGVGYDDVFGGAMPNLR